MAARPPCSKPIREKAQHGCIEGAPQGPHSAQFAPELAMQHPPQVHVYTQGADGAPLWGAGACGRIRHSQSVVNNFLRLPLKQSPVQGHGYCYYMGGKVAFSSSQGMVHFLTNFEGALCGKITCCPC